MQILNCLSNDSFISFWETIANPAVGTELTFVTPNLAQKELVLLTCTLTTDANVANRVVSIDFLWSTTYTRFGSASVAQAANEITHYTAHQNPMAPAHATIEEKMIGLPSTRISDLVSSIKITVYNIQVGDQLSDIRAWWKIWRGQ